jgi:hypothetical protein
MSIIFLQWNKAQPTMETEIPDIRVQFSIRVTCQNRQNISEDVSSHTADIEKWYMLGAKDFHDISEFTIDYNKKTGLFDVSFLTTAINEERDMCLADPDVGGDFPILIRGEAYYILGSIV